MSQQCLFLPSECGRKVVINVKWRNGGGSSTQGQSDCGVDNGRNPTFCQMPLSILVGAQIGELYSMFCGFLCELKLTLLGAGSSFCLAARLGFTGQVQFGISVPVWRT